MSYPIWYRPPIDEYCIRRLRGSSMILSGLEIKRRLGGDIIIDPFETDQLNPNSYNLRLHDEMLVYEEPELDMLKDNPTRQIRIPKTGFVLQPDELYLGNTIEWTKTQNLVPRIAGRSSVGRLGIAVHVTAGFGDVGYDGYWTLEITCKRPVRIYPGVEICQICYEEITGDIEEYNGKYQNARSAQASAFHTEVKRYTHLSR